jgi:sarcosine oxidase subunit gamma
MALPASAAVLLGERALQGHINLRGASQDRAFIEAVQNALKNSLPLVPNTVSASADLTAFWLGPDEWLLVLPSAQTAERMQALHAALSGRFAAVTDVSSGQTIITVSGPQARNVLAKGCTLDLHPRAFTPQRCAQTLLAKTDVLFWQAAADQFELIVRRSYADYLWRWLQDAAAD